VDPYAQLRGAFSWSFRKNIEEGNQAPHPGFVIYRGWKLFVHYLPARLPGFVAAFNTATGMTVPQYFLSAFTILPRTFFDHLDNQRIFDSDNLELDAALRKHFGRFMALHCFIDKLISAPVFFAIRGGLSYNRVFGAFGDAVEDYVGDFSEIDVQGARLN